LPEEPIGNKLLLDGGFDTAIKSDGSLWIWGNCSTGQLGNNISSGIVSTPITTFAGGTNWKQVSAGGFHTAAIKTDGTLWTWGNGTNVQLGTLSSGNRLTPVTTFLGGNDWKQVDGGDRDTSAIRSLDF
jgi:alpha-tubulin suppressor-like RCC1 family protein